MNQYVTFEDYEQAAQSYNPDLDYGKLLLQLQDFLSQNKASTGEAAA